MGGARRPVLARSPDGAATAPRRAPSCFDALRIAAALSVVVSHAYVLTGRGERLVHDWGDHSLDLGRLAVVVFFVVSGWLITSSWLGEPDARAFARKRLLRIWPALVVLVLGTTFVLGPLLTTVSPAEYWTSELTWRYAGNLRLLPQQDVLPGVFEANPGGRIVNGSLWTLPVEVGAYVLLCAAGLAGLVRRRWPLAAACVGLLGVVQLLPALNTRTESTPELLAYFLLGALARVYDVRMRPGGALVAVGAIVVAVVSGVYVLAAPALAYLVLFLGTRARGPLVHAGRWGDPSYGMYVYGYPLQQTLLALGVRDLGAFLVLSVALTSLAGYLSWHVVERPVLALARNRRAVETSGRQTSPAAP